jgi:hypothetical protein
MPSSYVIIIIVVAVDGDSNKVTLKCTNNVGQCYGAWSTFVWKQFSDNKLISLWISLLGNKTKILANSVPDNPNKVYLFSVNT